MKKTLWTLMLIALFTAPALAQARGKTYVCRLSKMTATLYTDGADGEFRIGLKSPRKPEQTNPGIRMVKVSRPQIQNDPELARVLKAAHLRIDQILGGKIYITDENNVGTSGLAVFTAGRGSMDVVGSAFFATYAGYYEACAND